MRRNLSLPPNKQNRPTSNIHAAKTRQSTIAPGAEFKAAGRDTKSKSQLTKATTRLIEFLESTDYPNALSPRILQSPNSKEVFCIFEHLVRQVDPNFRIEQRTIKVEELCLNILRTLGYPYALSKQYLATPGAPHAWPTVLSALDWLREEIENVNECISCGKIFEYDDEQNMDEEPIGSIVHRINLECYKQGSLSSKQIEQYQCEMNKIMGCPDPNRIRQMETYLSELKTKLSSLNDLDSEENYLKTQIGIENTKFQKLMDQKTKLKLTVSEIEPNYKRMCEECENLQMRATDIANKLVTIRAKIKEQDDAGFGRLAQEYIMLQERYEMRLKAKDDLTKEVEQMELDYSRREGKIAPALDAYNRLVGALRLPENSAIGNKCNLKICSYRVGFDITKRIPSLVEDVKSCLNQYSLAQNEFEQRIRDLNIQIENVQISIKNSDLSELQIKLDETRTELSKLDQLLLEEDEMHAVNERAFINERSEWSKKLDQLQKDLIKSNRNVIEVEESLDRKINERLNLANYIGNVQQQINIFLPWLEAQIEWKENTKQVQDSHIFAIRREIRSTFERIEKKVNSALVVDE